MESAVQSECVVKHIILRPFSTLPMEEKLRLVKMDIPQPTMKNLKSQYKKGGKTVTRNFNISSYNSAKWLCGSEALNKLFCWPCLLFHSHQDRGVWSKSGFNDLNHLSAAMKVHSSAKDHIDNSVAYKTFGKIRIDENLDHAREVAKTSHNLLVSKNRKRMKTLIEIVCYLGSHGLSFRGHDERSNSANRGNYKDLCSFISSRDSAFAEFLTATNVFTGTSSKIQNDLVESIGCVMMRQITKEVDEAFYVAIMMDETTDAARLAQLSCALRYVKHDGTPVERLVRLYDVSCDKTTSALASTVDSIASDFGLSADKIIAQSYDGAAVMSGELRGTQALVKRKFPKAEFIHCKAHILNLVLLHSCSEEKRTAKFFKTLSSLASFFSQSTKRNQALKSYMETKIPNVCRTKWAYTSRMVNVVNDNYTGILTCLGEIYLGDSSWDGDTCTIARGLHGFLLDFESIFLLKTFASFFCYTDVLYGILQQKELDAIECMKSVEHCRNEIETLKSVKYFENVYKSTIEIHGGEDKTRKKTKSSYQSLYLTIIERVLTEPDTRFRSLEATKYVGLLNSSKFKEYRECFPKKLFDFLVDSFGEGFDTTKLSNELKVLYSREEFVGKTVREIIALIVDGELEEVFSESLKLAKLILTLPSTTATVERSFSVMRRVKDYTRTTMGEERLYYLMLMAVEKDLLFELQSKPGFYDNVIETFAKKVDRRIVLLNK